MRHCASAAGSNINLRLIAARGRSAGTARRARIPVSGRKEGRELCCVVRTLREDMDKGDDIDAYDDDDDLIRPSRLESGWKVFCFVSSLGTFTDIAQTSPPRTSVVIVAIELV